MAKKNPYVFTIGFNSGSPEHIRVAEILNGTREKAQLIADAVLCYMGEKEEGETSGFSLSSIQPLVEQMIQQEVKKALQNGAAEQKTETEAFPEQIVSLTEEAELPVDDQLSKNIANVMSAFRKMK